MRKLVSTGIIAVLISCNSNPTSNTPTTTVSDSTMSSGAQDITYAYPISYSSNFGMDDPKNCQTVLNIWKAWRFNKDGKADLMYQYAEKPNATRK